MAGKDRDEQGTPTARQLLHWATGDRDAEAAALADASDDEVTERDAKRAVQEAHGDVGYDEAGTDGDVATSRDAEEAHEEHRR